MKSGIVLLSILVFSPVSDEHRLNFLPPNPIARSESAPELVVVRLSPRVITLHFQGPQISNIIALRSDKGIVVIDTEASPSLGSLLRSRIMEEFPGDTIRWVINTHGHGDHTWGNQAFAGADIIGQEEVVQEMAEVAGDAPADAERIGSFLERLETRLSSADPKGTEAAELDRTIRYYSTVKAGLEEGFQSTPPNLLFAKSLRLRLGDLSFHLVAFPGAHSRSDVLVLCPEERILATGDLFISRMRPPYLRTENLGQLPRWIEALERVLEDAPEIRHVIPGHDELLSIDDLLEVQEYFRAESRRVLGKLPALPVFQRIMEERGTEEALAQLDTLASNNAYFLMESDLVSLGYRFLYREQAPAKAVLVFKKLTELFPDSWNAWDCLGEASVEVGAVELARSSYRHSLDLNPQNDHAARALAELNESVPD